MTGATMERPTPIPLIRKTEDPYTAIVDVLTIDGIEASMHLSRDEDGAIRLEIIGGATPVRVQLGHNSALVVSLGLFQNTDISDWFKEGKE